MLAWPARLDLGKAFQQTHDDCWRQLTEADGVATGERRAWDDRTYLLDRLEPLILITGTL